MGVATYIYAIDLINFAEDCVLESINEFKGIDGEGGGGKEEE